MSEVNTLQDLFFIASSDESEKENDLLYMVLHMSTGAAQNLAGECSQFSGLEERTCLCLHFPMQYLVYCVILRGIFR